jgi:hypothetical protein
MPDPDLGTVFISATNQRFVPEMLVETRVDGRSHKSGSNDEGQRPSRGIWGSISEETEYYAFSGNFPDNK